MNTFEELSTRVAQIVEESYVLIQESFAAIGDEALDEKLDWEVQIKNKTDIDKALDLRDEMADDELLDGPIHQYAATLELMFIELRSLMLYVTKRTPEAQTVHKKELMDFFTKMGKYITELGEIGDIAHEDFFEWLNGGFELTKSTADSVSAKGLWDSFLLDAGSSMSNKQFAKALRFVGCEPYVGKIEGKSARVYRGIKRKE